MQAHYTQGSIYKHIISMSAMSAVGLVAIFLVDLVDLYFLSLLGEIEMASAIGFASTILFFTTAISIGLMIATGALVSKSIGRKKIESAKQYTTNLMVLCTLLGGAIGFGVWIYTDELLQIIGAQGRTLELASSYLSIIVPSLPFLCVAMSCTGALRAVGDAKQAMYVTLIAAILNAAFDPLLIFTFNMGIEGAAWSSVISRLGMTFYAMYLIINKHQLLATFHYQKFFHDISEISKVAVPATLTNIATPIGNTYMMYVLAEFGDSAVAGYSIIGRIFPVAFCLIFAISGAVGPVIGQNFGALLYDRVRETISKSFVIILVYGVLVSAILFMTREQLVTLFNVDDEAAELIIGFCVWVAILAIFRGFLFIANASFNNLGKAKYSTLMNFGKATIGTIPFVYYGAKYHGAFGVILYEAIGAIVFGLISSFMVFRVIKKLEQKHLTDLDVLKS